MAKKQNQEPFNNNLEPHGKWVCYYDDGRIWFIDNNVNGELYGYSVVYVYECELIIKTEEYHAR